MYKDLVKLSALTELETLTFHDVEATRAEKAALKAALPDTKIQLLDREVNYS
jgi:hypothetical protein